MQHAKPRVSLDTVDDTNSAPSGNSRDVTQARRRSAISGAPSRLLFLRFAMHRIGADPIAIVSGQPKRCAGRTPRRRCCGSMTVVPSRPPNIPAARYTVGFTVGADVQRVRIDCTKSRPGARAVGWIRALRGAAPADCLVIGEVILIVIAVEAGETALRAAMAASSGRPRVSTCTNTGSARLGPRPIACRRTEASVNRPRIRADSYMWWRCTF
jgi:hypothetical protein